MLGYLFIYFPRLIFFRFFLYFLSFGSNIGFILSTVCQFGVNHYLASSTFIKICYMFDVDFVCVFWDAKNIRKCYLHSTNTLYLRQQLRQTTQRIYFYTRTIEIMEKLMWLLDDMSVCFNFMDSLSASNFAKKIYKDNC